HEQDHCFAGTVRRHADRAGPGPSSASGAGRDRRQAAGRGLVAAHDRARAGDQRAVGPAVHGADGPGPRQGRAGGGDRS
nr:hypothetical protein [Tanacetum cinerariifolium]